MYRISKVLIQPIHQYTIQSPNYMCYCQLCTIQCDSPGLPDQTLRDSDSSHLSVRIPLQCIALSLQSIVGNRTTGLKLMSGEDLDSYAISI